MGILALRTITALYTDGACSGNPGRGGWGVQVQFTEGGVHELGGSEVDTTNNRMELQAAIAALEYLHLNPQSQSVTIYSDSEYVLKGITQWLVGWQRKGWKTAQGKPVLNRDLWISLDALNSPQVNWQYVRGHSGNPGNERCDAIARGFATGKPPRLQELEVKLKTGRGSQKVPLESDEHSTATEQIPMAFVETPGALNFSQLDEHHHNGRGDRLRNMIDCLNIAEEVASKSYFITSAELADLMEVNPGAVTSRGEQWVWRNWQVSRIRREGNQILWQLERIS
jgi:ribonuclease HI